MFNHSSPLSTSCPYHVTLRPATPEEQPKLGPLMSRVWGRVVSLTPAKISEKISQISEFVIPLFTRTKRLPLNRLLEAHRHDHPILIKIKGQNHFNQHPDVAKAIYEIRRQSKEGLFTRSTLYFGFLTFIGEIFNLGFLYHILKDYRYGILTADEPHHTFFRKAINPLLNNINSTSRQKIQNLAADACTRWFEMSQETQSISISKSIVSYTSAIISKIILGYKGSAEELAEAIEALNEHIATGGTTGFTFDKDKSAFIRNAVEEMLGEDNILEISGRAPFLAQWFSENHLTPRQMKVLIVFLFFAGQETSASLLQTIIYYLSQNPHLQEDIYRDIQAQKEQDLSKLLNLESLKNVVYEGLRIVPPIPFAPRTVQKPAILELKDQQKVVYKKFLPQFADLNHCPVLMGKDPNYFENPTEFRPERHQNIDEMHWMPFGRGKDGCAGQHLAKLSVKIFLLELIRNYTFTSHHKGELPVQGVATLKPTIDIQIQLKKR